ncbi:MAG: NADH-quinone oxidoreductase subunit D [Planctomycetota bacterium]|nr:MAG: NADH-quinone oxidoreductase subunit D [Planctomycetota bacterium]
MALNMGPQHPSTHGVLRLRLLLDGETILEVDPDVGYLHRGKEKMAEDLGWRKFFPHTDRMDYCTPVMPNLSYALALERLAHVEVPERAQVIRVLFSELGRIAAHLIYTGTTGIDLGAVTMFFYCFREREKILDILDQWSGHRMNNTYVRLGGVAADLSPRVVEMVDQFSREFPAKLDEFEELLTGNRIWYGRNKGVAEISGEQAVAMGLTGPSLRGSGVAYDIRKAQPYSGYERYEFDVPIGTCGDCYDRYLVRIAEMRESCRIVRQALERLPGAAGDHLAHDTRFVLPPRGRVATSMEELIHQFKVVTAMALPRGEVYQAIESSKGELGFYLVSDGTPRPVRVYTRSPSFVSIQAIPTLAQGHLLSDMVAIIGSLDFVMGECDK